MVWINFLKAKELLELQAERIRQESQKKKDKDLYGFCQGIIYGLEIASKIIKQEKEVSKENVKED